MQKITLTIQTQINAPLKKVWQMFILPEHIIHWNYAIDTWHTPKATNDFCVGGKFIYRMEAKDGSMGFDFWGTYTFIDTLKKIDITLGDERKMSVLFEEKNNITTLIETFEAETQNPPEMQQVGWQNILNNFKNYVEKN